jgi:DNA-binding NarL/FixJ family response regulator
MLLVDAHDGSRRALAALLRAQGFQVSEARNGVEGLRTARQRPPRLIVLDPWPFVSASLQMLERLREDGATHDVPVLVLASELRPEHWRRARAAGCAGYLEKPCRPEDALTAVRRILAGTTPVAGSDMLRLQRGLP